MGLPVIKPFQHQSSVVNWDARKRRSAGGSLGRSGAVVAMGMFDA